MANASPQPPFPEMFRVHQAFDTTAIEDIDAAIDTVLHASPLSRRVTPGQRVAIAVGSRGIDRLATIVAATVRALKAVGLDPFIFPAMGSHGGATAEGQIAVLRALGIHEARVKAPIVATMKVKSLGKLSSGAVVAFGADGLSADHVFLINRIKPHTAFRGKVESGLCKMLAVGCGKHHGAVTMHKFGLADSIVPAAELILQKVPILGGLALVENALDKVATLRWVPAVDFVAMDGELLALARRQLPRLPIETLDILIVDEMGKNISGTGVDPNVVGFWRREAGERRPDYRTLIVLDLTDVSKGNAVGMGMIDLTTQRMLDKIDLAVTHTNVLATGIWSGGRTPMALSSDQEVIAMALSKIPVPSQVRLARIVNTLHLETFWVTRALLPELQAHQNLRIDPAPHPMIFDDQGRLAPAPTNTIS
jgi:hypothetical protein